MLVVLYKIAGRVRTAVYTRKPPGYTTSSRVNTRAAVPVCLYSAYSVAACTCMFFATCSLLDDCITQVDVSHAGYPLCVFFVCHFSQFVLLLAPCIYYQYVVSEPSSSRTRFLQ